MQNDMMWLSPFGLSRENVHLYLEKNPKLRVANTDDERAIAFFILNETHSLINFIWVNNENGELDILESDEIIFNGHRDALLLTFTA
jgi:hypothetical protein